MLLLAVLCLAPSARAVAAQQQPPTSAAREVVVRRVARATMVSARFAALITQDGRGGTSARTIDPLPPDSSFVVRFATNPRSRKVRELTRNARVTLYYFDATAMAYVSLHGRARVLADTTARRRYWNPEWTPHYAGRTDEALLVEVRPEVVEVVSLRDGLTGDSLTWLAPSARFPRAPRRR